MSPDDGYPRSPSADDTVDEIKTSLFAGRKIEAIKRYRQLTGADLKEAKDFVEALQAELWATDPTRFAEPPRKAGCGGLVVLLLLLILLGLAAVVVLN